LGLLLWRRRITPTRLSARNEKHRGWLRRMKCFIFDIDGVIHNAGTPVQGAGEAVEALRAAGKKVLFMTNNATKSQEDLMQLFSKLGVTAEKAEIMTSSIAAGDYLCSKGLQGRKVYVVGMKALCDCLEERAGVLTCGGEEDAGKDREDVMKTFLPELEPPAKEVVAVVCGADFAFNYYKLAKAANYLRQNPGALFVATNPDPRALMAPGTFFPAAGSMWSAIAVAAGRQPDIVCGKPSETLARYLLSSKGLSPDTTCMVGDRTDTDIAFGRSVGMQTLFVASGSMTEQEVMQENSTDQPHYVADSIAILGQLLKPEK
ncbi:PGLP2, partial [Symbiodinium necroappetens]